MIPEDMTGSNNYMMATAKDLIYFDRIIKEGIQECS